MPQITLYVDEETRKMIERAAESSGLSQSRWVVEVIHRQVSGVWPLSFLELAGRFPDFPLREEANALPEDSHRIGW